MNKQLRIACSLALAIAFLSMAGCKADINITVSQQSPSSGGVVTSSAVSDNNSSESEETPSSDSGESTDTAGSDESDKDNTDSGDKKPNGNAGSSSGKNPPSGGNSNSGGSSHTHSWNTSVVDPTCTEGGYTLKTCSCGENEKSNVTSAYGHDWSGWSVIKAATTSANGLMRRNCNYCSNAEEKTTDKLPASLSANQSEMLRLINAERAKAGLNPLLYNVSIQSAADTRLSEISLPDDAGWGHTRPNGSKWYTVLSGINYKEVDENIAYDNGTTAQVLEAWMADSGSRKKLLNPELTYIAISEKDYYWVAIMYSPAD